MTQFLNRVKQVSATTSTGTVTLGAASTGYVTAATAGGVDGQVVSYLIEDTGNAWEVGYGVLGSSATTMTRNLEKSSTGSLLNLSGSETVSFIVAASDVSSGFFTPQGRVTLTTGVPVITAASTTAQTTIYYTPYIGAYIPIWNGQKTVKTLFSELSQATTDSTKSPAAVAASKNYDIFVWNDASTIRATRGPAWSSDTSRGSGAGTTQITRNTDGYLTNTVAITNGPGAGLGTYVGTVRSNGSSQIDYILGGVGVSGGESTILGVWNMYNRVDVSLANIDSATQWTYNTAAFRVKHNLTTNEISFVIGLAEDALAALNVMVAQCSAVNGDFACGIGLNSATAVATASSNVIGLGAVANGNFPMACNYQAAAPLGFNYLAPLEWADTATTTWFGVQPAGAAQTMFSARVRA